MVALTRSLLICLFPLALAACSFRPPVPNISATHEAQPTAAARTVPAGNDLEAEPPFCPLTEPAWVTAPADAAVQGTPAPGYYFVNEDRSLWASAGWTSQAGYPLRASEDGIKVGWFRPAAATLAISGRRLDGEAAPLEAHVPCCYPTRFQASGPDVLIGLSQRGLLGGHGHGRRQPALVCCLG